ncbi:hypothetical protein DNTS_033500 [Danionella cerebrum]|uniref:Sperm-associated antigen 5 n=1 Tax=Danionella cerebrum TaxID=2873325 RepID=A0A553PE41_9TELE|nr:hypothetical protein DNTS_033500 [Danionella translucida]
MSSLSGFSSPNPERFPLQDVQNIQETLSLTFKQASVDEKDPRIKQKNVFGESKDHSTDICNELQILDTTDEDVIIQSFPSLEGEVVIEDDPFLSDASILISRLALEDNIFLQCLSQEPDETEHSEENQNNENNSDHPYSCTSRSSGSDASPILYLGNELSSSEGGTVALKSSLSLGGEILVSDNCAISDESIILKELALGGHSLCETMVVTNVDTEAVSVYPQPLGHSYCVTNHKPLSEESFTPGTVDSNGFSCSTDENTVGTHKPSDLSEGSRGFLLKNQHCPGIEIDVLSKVSEMVILKENLAEEQNRTYLNDIDGGGFASLTPGHEHEMLQPQNTSYVEPDVFYKSFGSSTGLGNVNEPLRTTTNDVFATCYAVEQTEKVCNLESNQHFLLSQDVNKAQRERYCKGKIEEPKNLSSTMADQHTEKHNLLFLPSVCLRNVDLETSKCEKKTLDSDIQLEIKEMQLCASNEAVAVQDAPSAIGLTGSCILKTPTLSRSVLRGSASEITISHLWPELPESPIPPPLLNSTSLTNAFSTPVVSENKEHLQPKMACADEKNVLNGHQGFDSRPLQDQLRQMAELLMAASRKVAVPTPEPVNKHNALVGTSAVSVRSELVLSSPVERMERSMNTSAAIEILKEADVSDASTSTDSLLWSLPPGNLGHLSRSELEQRLTSTLVMVEVLSQQLTSARVHNPGKETSPSDLRDKLIQTEHTELRQNGTYRDLYKIALEGIGSLEQDQGFYSSLHNSVQAVRSWMMKSVLWRYKEILLKMEQKVNSMRLLMEEALEEKKAAFSVTQQLRNLSVAQVAELERATGSYQQLMAALSLAYPTLVDLSNSYAESISAASVHLKKNQEDNASLLEELRKAQKLIQRTKPVLQDLLQRTATAFDHCKEHLALRDRAVEERELMKNELELVKSSLEDARQQISDLNTQQTILTSELSVLREQLNQAEEERFQLQRTNTELSSTVTSTLASYTFLEQSLASETRSLQQSKCDAQQATERANSLEEALEASRKQLEQYKDTVFQSETLIEQLQSEAEIHRGQLAQQARLQVELSSLKETMEFLEAENKLARDQMEESEALLLYHLQGLRERNLECEDLKLAQEQLRLEKESLEEELKGTQDKARCMLLEQGEQMAQACNEVMLLNQRVSALTAILKESLISKEPESFEISLRRSPSSFVDSVMVAMMKTQETEAEKTDSEEGRCTMLELLSDLSGSIADLQCNLDLMRMCPPGSAAVGISNTHLGTFPIEAELGATAGAGGKGCRTAAAEIPG